MMTSKHHISALRPHADETLMSFLRRAQDDAGYSEEGFSNIVAGSHLTDSRRAERREFDWWTLGRFFNATPDELHAHSERSLFYGMGDGGRQGHFRQRAPWVQAVGYGAHSPAALKGSEHWRKSWLGPTALVCREHKNLLVRHCHGCGGDFEEMYWRRPIPVCPACGAHLALGPVIPADDGILYFSERLSHRYEMLEVKKPVERHDHELAYFAVLWRATRLLKHKWRFASFRPHFSEWVGIGEYAAGDDFVQLAIRHAQCTIMAHVICEMEPTLVEHYWLLAATKKDLKRADDGVLLKLTEFVENFTGRKLQEAVVRGQTTISFASWSGWKSTPKAA